MDIIKSRTVDHPYFSYCTKGASPFTFVFNKDEWGPQDPKALARWEKNRKIVEAHGGRMIEDGYRVGREHQGPITAAEVVHLKELVKEENPDLIVYTHWNGAGCYTLSVGARKDTR